ncbi:MAG: hypothetical protein H7Y27_07665, partial [Gemmatimonadaceae bacterium]|nr:hypothetical protein [Chitinophagaceae bacterium]
MKKIIFALTILFTAYQSYSQGCVAIRSTGGFCTADQTDAEGNANSNKWLFNFNTRYFKSWRHFVGTEEQKQRKAAGTEVINHNTSIDFFLSRNLNKYWSIAIDLPVINNARSSLYEHGGKKRHSTHSFGLGDIRIAAYRWLADPAKNPKGNIQLGAGIKFATGDYKYQDFFYTSDTTKVLGPVDQSIQLGDGGTGFTTEMNGYYNFS